MYFVLPYIQDGSEDLTFHYWALFDGHAGSGAAVMASRLLHHHIALHLQEVMEILCTPNLLPPTCLDEEPVNHLLSATSHRALSRAASLRGAAGAPGSPSTPPTRFFTEKKVSQESLVIGAIENAFKDMVSSALDLKYQLRYCCLILRFLTVQHYSSLLSDCFLYPHWFCTVKESLNG
ncbi:Protein phosphatase 1H [Xenoophorus captivus]|uniref:Protein phosphatase 1H n=1 Tax=Xenoophorus captivus TaxID=1517983 RepID=A0ABV0RFR3_9TELE